MWPTNTGDTKSNNRTNSKIAAWSSTARNAKTHISMNVIMSQMTKLQSLALADWPEKEFLLKISLLGVFGKIESWAADSRPDVLVDYHKCFFSG